MESCFRPVWCYFHIRSLQDKIQHLDCNSVRAPAQAQPKPQPTARTPPASKTNTSNSHLLQPRSSKTRSRITPTNPTRVERPLRKTASGKHLPLHPNTPATPSHTDAAETKSNKCKHARNRPWPPHHVRLTPSHPINSLTRPPRLHLYRPKRRWASPSPPPPPPPSSCAPSAASAPSPSWPRRDPPSWPP